MAEKGGLGQFTDLRGGLGEKEEMVFLRGGGGAGGGFALAYHDITGFITFHSKQTFHSRETNLIDQ